ncbi:C40 family peptidase [Streptomyces pini]|uniref:Cell wall-associated hydrolase, NlpC family n=1 Tax=Streptomyces pini TaxID=1520580 RepID=A0A1I4K2J8_9ACTN|nr:C40 family peptidase [Streptomyces pini]SFL72666.1 Cell wall-associated hydrolase, NlpC family [Streptomyces pini]
MSQTAHIPSHRKPRRAGRNPLLRTGVAGGVLSTLAVTAAAAPASAEERKTAADTAEMPVIVPDAATGALRAADANRTVATRYETEAARTLAAEQAMDRAGELAEKKKAEAERRAAEAAEAERERAARERAARDSRRTSLGAAPAENTAPATSAAPAASAPAGSGNAATLVNFLRAQVGKAYVMGATGPSAYDCSSLTQAAFRQIGISLPRTSQPQSTAGTQVSLSNVRPGDILYWGSAGNAYHVAVYIGNGRFIGAQNPSTGVVERDMSYDMPTGAVRVL